MQVSLTALRRLALGAGLALTTTLTIPNAGRADPAAAAPCQPGAYGDGEGHVLAITARPNTAQTGEWRYTRMDGRLGSTKGGPVVCGKGEVRVDGKPWPRLALRSTPTRFRSGDATLAGVLIEPRPGSRTGGRPPLVVLVQGSESTASIDTNSMQFLLPTQGVSVFVFDKRGAGASEGTYNQNFHRLAADVVAASEEARRLAAGRYGRFGLYGGSQGGWVAPRAANEARADFVVVGFGLLLNPLEEDAEQVFTELREAGYGDDVIARAREVTDATGTVIASHFQDGYTGLAAVKAKYGAEPWFKAIKGEFTGEVLAADEAALRREGRAKLDNLDLDWRYDAIGYLLALKAPLTWVVAGEDREAPPALTIARLQALRREGKAITLYRFPGTDHSMIEFTQAPDGTRTMTRITDGYFRLVADTIKGERRPPYGRGEEIPAP